MSFWKRTPVAVTVLILCVVLGTVLGCWRSCLSLRTQAETLFYSGTEGDGIGVASDLTARRDAARNLVTVALRYLQEDDFQVQNTLQAIAQVDGAAEIQQKKEADQQLEEAVLQLNERLKLESLSEADENYRQNLMAEMVARDSTISHDGYNDAAQRYNQILGSLPAGAFGRLFGLEPLELFR